jgi:2-aminoadipate transaminase
MSICWRSCGPQARSVAAALPATPNPTTAIREAARGGSVPAGFPPRLEGVETISLARGIPGPELLPVAELADCARAAIERDGRTILNYGAAGGYRPLREWIGERHGVDPERVVLTNGSLQGLAFLAGRLASRGRVLVEAPTYDRPLKLLAELDADVCSVPLDEEGLDVDVLESELRAGPAASFLYTIPTFQNPSGRTLSTERRRRLVELARKHALLIVEDDPYGLIRFEGESPPTLFELADGEEIVYGSSFSKTIAPGARVGYLVMPGELAQAVAAAATATYITPSLIGEAAVYEFLRRGLLAQNLERIKAELGARRDAMLAALERELGGAARWSHPEGGYFVWLELAERVDARDLLRRAEAAGVTFVPGSDFGGPPNSLRLAFSFVGPDAVAEGIARLASAVPAATTVELAQ